MNRPTFDHTVGVLVKAFLKGTLAHKLCTACAVGNIVADIKKTVPDPSPDNNTEFECWTYANGDRADWYEVVCEAPDKLSPRYRNGLKQIESTGYTVEEIVRIEYAFEHAPGDPGDNFSGLFRGRCIDPDWMFNGLMAVVDVLASIHNVDLSIKEEAKKLFVKV